MSASPDTGGTRRAATYAKYLEADLAIGFKQRPRRMKSVAYKLLEKLKIKMSLL